MSVAMAMASQLPSLLPYSIHVGTSNCLACTTEASCRFPPASAAALPRSALHHHASTFLAFMPLSSPNAAESRRGSRRSVKVVAMATGETESSNIATNLFEGLQEAWDKTDEKLAIGGLGFAALIVLWASAGLISAIDKLPFLPALFEFVGILFTGWFVYRYLVFKPDREELVKKIEDAKQKITGQ